MDRRVMVTATAMTLAITTTVVAITHGRGTSPRASGTATSALPTSVPKEPGFRQLAERDTQIVIWHQALDADPTSAIVLTQLAALHAQRAREGGGWNDYLVAEQYARRSIAKRTNRNAPAAVTLVSVLLAQHRFAEAYTDATALVRREPDIPQYRSLLGEVAMEVGDYDTARAMFDSLWTQRAALSTAPRLARWLELNNQVPEARRILTAARDDAMRRRDVATETKAWFNLRVGDLELRAGRPRAAESAFRAGLAVEPEDPRLFAAMARLAQVRGGSRDVITWGERAIGLQLDPATLGLVGDAYAALGDSAKSGEYFHTLEVAVSAQPGPYHRAWSLYLLDHGLRSREVLRKAEEELADRKDIYGYDLVAWALHKSGRDGEAAAMMRRALVLGTPDPLLTRHAAEIAAAIGRTPATLAANVIGGR
jgi:tetratricopeptide (TPR) repeat protein